MRLLATGEFEAAEQQKLAIIQRAEGEREAVIQVAQGKAEAIRLVNEAAERYFIGNAQALKRMEMIENSLRQNSNHHYRAWHQPDPAAGQSARQRVERERCQVSLHI